MKSKNKKTFTEVLNEIRNDAFEHMQDAEKEKNEEEKAFFMGIAYLCAQLEAGYDKQTIELNLDYDKVKKSYVLAQKTVAFLKNKDDSTIEILNTIIEELEDMLKKHKPDNEDE